MILPLETQVEATIGADGSARVSLGPVIYGTTWKVARVVVTTTSTSATQFRLYRNSVAPARQVDSTFRGNDATSEESPPIPLYYGENLIGVWSLGTPGATARMSLYGDVDTGR